MNLADLLRQVKRLFGDEYGFLIIDQDILDWAYECQVNIIRDTADNNTTVDRVANTFPVTISDTVLLKRVSIGNRAIAGTSLEELDAVQFDTSQQGTPKYWYRENNQLKLWPVPKSTDTSTVSITYSKLPTKLSLVAPYLKWYSNPPSNQYATIAADTDYDTNDLCIYFEITMNNPLLEYTMIGKGTSLVAANLGWALNYAGVTVGNGNFVFRYSNGTTVRTATLTVPVFTAGEKRKFKLTYNAATGTAAIYSVSSTGVETLVDSDVQSAPFLINTTAGFDVTFGSMEGGASYTNSEFLLHYFKMLYGNGLSNQVVIEFDGSLDLPNLPTIPATPFTMTSGRPMSVNGGLQIYSPDNVLSVPEVWHNDIVRFCLARAHEKNRDNRNYEQTMKEFDQKVSLRRNEQDAIDGPEYKISDPYDFDWEVY